MERVGTVAHRAAVERDRQAAEAPGGNLTASLVVNDCIERAQDAREWNYEPDYRDVTLFGLNTVADSLAAIKKVVFDEKKVTMGQLLEALEADFVGHEAIRQMCIKALKYGNNDLAVDQIGHDIEAFFAGLAHRQQARRVGNFPQESHHGILQTVAGLQTRNLKQQRTGWAEKAGAFRDTGEYFYFVGCLPFFDVTFRHLNLSPLETARSMLKLLNKGQPGVNRILLPLLKGHKQEIDAPFKVLWQAQSFAFQVHGGNLGELGIHNVSFLCGSGTSGRTRAV